MAKTQPQILAEWQLCMCSIAQCNWDCSQNVIQDIIDYLGTISDAGNLKVANNLSDVASAATSRTNLGVGYIIPLLMGAGQAAGSGGFNPTAGTTYYGPGWASTVGSSSAPSGGVFVPISGTIKTVSLTAVAFQGASSNNNCTISIRKNNTTDYSVSTTLNLSTTVWYQQITGLTIPISAGDYLVIKFLTNTGTAPQGVSLMMQCFVQ